MTKFYKKNYPRPQLVRESYISLNGEWAFLFDYYNKGEINGWFNGFTEGTINVPFSYESKLSGIGTDQQCESVWYCKQAKFPHTAEERVLLNLEGCDYLTKLWVNGRFIGEHSGGYTRFSFDITNALNDDAAVIVIQANDSKNTAQPRGKQRWLDENYDCWYTQTTGIWKTVWAEVVNEAHLKQVKITPKYDENSVRFEYQVGEKAEGNLELETIITFRDTVICQTREPVLRPFFSRTFSLIHDFTKWKVKYWSPNSPNLYDVEIRIYRNGVLADRVGSYFGVRKISSDTGRFTLNNMEIYLKMVLDQGYWADGLLTPPDEETLLTDLKKALEYGYNGIRKHQKIEDERFYYWADVLGVLVWCESPSTYEFNSEAVQKFTSEWISIVEQHYNHPSVVTWVPFNESWGLPRIYTDKEQQNFTKEIYYLTKSLDPTRPVITNDGWEHTISDMLTLHDYASDGRTLLQHWNHKDSILNGDESFNDERFALAKGHSYCGQPILLSEFGGIAFQAESGWGYGQAESEEENFLNRFRSLIDAIAKLDFVCGFCYTELTDVQQEMNGHMNMDRMDKIDPKKIREILESIG